MRESDYKEREMVYYLMMIECRRHGEHDHHQRGIQEESEIKQKTKFKLDTTNIWNGNNFPLKFRDSECWCQRRKDIRYRYNPFISVSACESCWAPQFRCIAPPRAIIYEWMASLCSEKSIFDFDRVRVNRSSHHHRRWQYNWGLIRNKGLDLDHHRTWA